MFQEMRDAIGNRQILPPPEAAERLRAEAQAALDVICHSLTAESRNLAIEPPNGCPADLGKQLAAFNERVAEHRRGEQEIVQRVSVAPLALAGPIDGDEGVSELAGEGSKISRDMFLHLGRWQELVMDRSKLLAEVRLLLLADLADAERRLDAARAAADKNLRRAGTGPEDDVQYQNNAQAAMTRFELRIEACRPVRAAKAALGEVRAKVEAIDKAGAGVEADLAVIGRPKAVLWSHMTGLPTS